MIKLVLPLLLAVLTYAQPYKAVSDFDTFSVMNKQLYINAILTTTPINTTLDNWQQFCMGYIFTPISSNKILAQQVLLSNFSTYLSTFETDLMSESTWIVKDAVGPNQWASFGTFQSPQSWKWIYFDPTNDYYAFVQSTDEGDMVVILTGYWQTRFAILSKLTQAVVRAGFRASHFGYYFTQCSGYTYDRGYYPGYYPMYSKAEAAQSVLDAPSTAPPDDGDVHNAASAFDDFDMPEGEEDFN